MSVNAYVVGAERPTRHRPQAAARRASARGFGADTGTTEVVAWLTGHHRRSRAAASVAA